MNESEKQIINDYTINKLSAIKIAKNLGITAGTVYYVLYKNEVPRRSLSNSHIWREFDRNFFKKIDTEEKAYILGYFYADGNIHKNIVQICLHPQDEEFLIKLKKAFKADHLIRNDGKYKRFSITSEDLANDFRKLGCHDKKTFTLEFPKENQVPNHLTHHFMRGYFDGDGCIKYIIDKKYGLIKWGFEVISCYNFLIKYQEILVRNCSLNINPLRREPRREKPIYYMSYGSTNNILLLKIFDFLYKDATIFLSRKHNKFIEINNEILKRNEWRELNPIFLMGKSIEEVRLVLENNANKPIEYVCELLGRKDEGCVRNLFKKLNIKRTKPIKI